MRSRWLVRLLAAAGLASIAGCATAEPVDVYATLMTEMERCAQTLGYDRGRELSLADSELAPGEKAWRACVYAGIEELIVPHAARPEAYRELIQADREMTEAIAKGQLGRAERRARLDGMLARIELAERERRDAETARELEMLRDLQERQRLIEEMNRIQRNAAEMHRRLRPR